MKEMRKGQIPGRQASCRSHRRAARRVDGAGWLGDATGASALRSTLTLLMLSLVASRAVIWNVNRPRRGHAETRIHCSRPSLLAAVSGPLSVPTTASRVLRADAVLSTWRSHRLAAD